MAIKNFYTARSAEPDDIFVVVVKAMVQYNGTYRLYRCPYESNVIPQGAQLYDENGVGVVIFPVLRTSKGQDPTI